MHCVYHSISHSSNLCLVRCCKIFDRFTFVWEKLVTQVEYQTNFILFYCSHAFIRLKIFHYIVNMIWHDIRFRQNHVPLYLFHWSERVQKRVSFRRQKLPNTVVCMYNHYPLYTSGSLYLYAQLQIQITDSMKPSVL